MESNAVITRMPHSKGRIFNFTFKSPVTQPASAPTTKENRTHSQGLKPCKMSTPVNTAPNGTVPSTERSGKSKML